MAKFKPRTECPKSDNLWYCRIGYGGKNPCIAGKPEKWKGSVLSNCVGYAFGRVAEILGRYIKIGYTTGTKPYTARKWYPAHDGLPRGQTPKLGAVACWVRNDNESGHVCIVEKIYDDGSWQSSESAYHGAAWKTRKYPKSSYRSGYKFQGFIYIPFEPTEDLEVGDKVKIVGKGFSSSNGGISTSRPIGWTREIIGIKTGARYPYRVGTKGITTAWYSAEALKKL